SCGSRPLVRSAVLSLSTASLLSAASTLISRPPTTLGPRNIVAYVVFFEVARHLMTYADKLAAQYVELRRAHPAAGEWGVKERTLRHLDWLFNLCKREATEEAGHEAIGGAPLRDRVGGAVAGVQQHGPGGRERLHGDGDGPPTPPPAALRLRGRQDREERVR